MEKNADAQTIKILGYVNHKCPICGKSEMEHWTINSKSKHICDKCCWCEEDKIYVDWNYLVTGRIY